METKKERIPFDEAYNKIQYFSVEKSMEKTKDEVAEEIRIFIRSLGWDCLEDSWNYDEDVQEWVEDHPDLKKNPCEFYCGPVLEFLCDNEMGGPHDVDWYEFEVSFYGKWGEEGVFYVDV